MSCDFFRILGPGRPSAGRLRMDRRAVTSPLVVKISRLARLRHSARRGPDPTAVLIKLFMKTYDMLSCARNDPPIKKHQVTHMVPRRGLVKKRHVTDAVP